MNFQELMRGVDLPNDLTRLIGKLLEKKRATEGMGQAPRIEELDDFVITEFAQAKALAPDAIKPDRQNTTAADELFPSIVKKGTLKICQLYGEISRIFRPWSKVWISHQPSDKSMRLSLAALPSVASLSQTQ